MDVVLGIDLGTGSLKAGLFGLDGSVVGQRRITFGAASQQDPRDWWSAFASACRDLIQPGVNLRAVCVGGQAPTLVPVDEHLEPTHPAITWLDSRPSHETERLYARLGQPVPVWGSWPGQAAWFVHHRPEELRQTRWILGAPDYLVSRLIGAPRALLSLNGAELEAGELDARWFPLPWTPGETVGGISSAAGASTHLPSDTPVVGGHVDGLLGVLGSGVRQPGEACVNCGTSGTYSVVCDPPLGYAMFGVNVAGTATNTAGAALDWFAATIVGGRAELQEAASIEPGAGGLLFSPQLAGERGATPDPFARAAWVGLTLRHERRHLARAVLEGVAFSFRSMQEWLETAGAVIASVRCVGGMAHGEVWNQILADVLNQSLDIPVVVEAASLGAGILGAVAIGAYADLDSATRAMVHIARRFEPKVQHVSRYGDLYTTYKRLYPALRETNARLHEFEPSENPPLTATQVAPDDG